MQFNPLRFYYSGLKIVDRYFWSEDAVASRPAYIRYTFTFLLVCITTMVKVKLSPFIGTNTPFLLYFAIVIVATGFGGVGPGIFATFLSAISSSYFFIIPVHEFQISKLASITLIVFIVECLLLISLSGAVTRASKRVRRSASRFRAMIENGMDGIVVFNSAGKVLYASPTTATVIGYSPAEFRKLDLFKKVHPEDIDSVVECYKTILKVPGDVKTVLHRFMHKNGQIIWIESTLTNLLGNPVIKGIVSNFRNVTERVKLEKQKEDFIGIATHELKTPVTSIKAYAQILNSRFRKEGNLSSSAMVEKMDVQLNKLIGLIGDLLDVTKIEGGRLQLCEEWYDFNQNIREVVEELQRTTDKHEIKLLLPQSAIEVHGDKERIGQVVSNLISNAIKYSPNANLINVSVIQENDHVALEVKDYGIGISENEQQHVFERFFRVSGERSNTYPGLGLGLFISREIIKRQGGTIWVNSRVGKGSVFSFKIPLNYTDHK